MPELPEVETTRRGIAPHLEGRRVSGCVVRQARLRWPIPDLRHLSGQTVRSVRRRAKYLLIDFDHGSMIIHLGMSGSLRVLPCDRPPRTHDHFDLCLGKQCLRLHDPRRFGAMLWAAGDDPSQHPRLADLGPEPLSEAFDGACLQRATRGRRTPIKALLMDGRVVVGVGNIYATEALFHAGIHPARASGRVSRARLDQLAGAVKAVLRHAIERGGTTLRDFVNESGEPGYFAQELFVYGRAGQPCRRCGSVIRTRQIGQRASAYCPHCQH